MIISNKHCFVGPLVQPLVDGPLLEALAPPSPASKTKKTCQDKTSTQEVLLGLLCHGPGFDSLYWLFLIQLEPMAVDGTNPRSINQQKMHQEMV